MKSALFLFLSLVCAIATAKEVKRSDLVGTWQSEDMEGRGVSIIVRDDKGAYQIKSYLVDHDLKIYYLRDEWKGTWKFEAGHYIAADPEAHFVGQKMKCKWRKDKLVFTYQVGGGVSAIFCEIVDTPSKSLELTYSKSYREVKSDAEWEKELSQLSAPKAKQESDAGGKRK